MAEPASPVEGRIGFRVKALQQALRSSLDAALRPTGISTSAYATLAAIRDAPQAWGAALAARTFMTPQSLNEQLVALERRGLIRRRPHPTHGRIIEARLTPAGDGALRRADAIVLGVEEQMLRPLSPRRRLVLAELLEACQVALTSSAEGSTRRVAGGPSGR